SGTHEIENEGTIKGDILVDQQQIGATVGSREFTLENEGKLAGNITIREAAGANNTVTLTGDGFGRNSDGTLETGKGNIIAENGTGTNVLNLQGSGELRGNVTKFTTLNLGSVGGAPVDDDDDESGLTSWTLAAGKTFEFSDAANVNSGLLYVSGNLIANTIVNEDGILSGDGTITGNLANIGTVAVDIGKTLSVTGNAVFNDDSAFAVGVSSTGSGKLAVTGTADFDDDAVVKPIVVNSVIKNGNSFTLLTSSGLTGTPQVQSSALVKWDVIADPNNLIFTANVQNAGASGVTGASNSSLTSLLSFDSALGAQFQNLETDAEVRKAAEQLRPEVNGASVQAVQGLTDRVYGLVGAHLGETHLAKASGNSGVASGDAANDSGVWFQGFGGRGDQGRRSGVDGYDIDAYGFAAGADTLVSDSNVRVGAALSYGQSNVEDKGVRTGNRTDINSYQGLAYASWLFDQWYLNAALGLGQHKFDDKKLVLGNKITGSHDAWQYSARIDAGYPIQLGSARLIPVASMTYSHLNQDSYTENGLGAQKISADNSDSLRSGLGLKALFPLYEGGVNASLELRTIWNHELADRSQDMTARFVGGGSAYTVKGLDLPRDSANLGASLRVSSVGQSLQQSLLLSYDAEVKYQFTSHTARLQARFDF
ncbi:MAG: autotransporter domain-containing protein, partial [Pseudomonadota bacterium]